MIEREQMLERARKLREEVEALSIQDRCDEFAEIERILADALLEAKAEGADACAERAPAICMCPNEEVAATGVHERACPAGIHRRCREYAAELRAQKSKL